MGKVVQSGSTKPLPTPIVGIKQKSWLTLLGATFKDNPCSWDLHVNDLLLNKRKSRIKKVQIENLNAVI